MSSVGFWLAAVFMFDDDGVMSLSIIYIQGGHDASITERDIYIDIGILNHLNAHTLSLPLLSSSFPASSFSSSPSLLFSSLFLLSNQPSDMRCISNPVAYSRIEGGGTITWDSGILFDPARQWPGRARRVIMLPPLPCVFKQIGHLEFLK